MCRQREAIVAARRRLAKKYLKESDGKPNDWDKLIASL